LKLYLDRRSQVGPPVCNYQTVPPIVSEGAREAGLLRTVRDAGRLFQGVC
jgi:hypothetical protein